MHRRINRPIPALLVVLAAPALLTVGATPPPLALTAIAAKTQSQLHSAQKVLGDAAEALRTGPFDAGRVRQVLRQAHAAFPKAVTCSFIDAKGILLLIEPGPRAFEGTDISTQPQVLRTMQDRKPLLSGEFLAVEGYTAVVFHHPVFRSGVFLGALSLLLRPESFLREIVEDEVRGLPVEVWVMETDGMLLYDPDPEEIGRDLFSDPLYKPFGDFRDAVRHIAGTRQGFMTYRSPNAGPEGTAVDEAFWTTVGASGTDWRIVLTKASTAGRSYQRSLSVLGLKKADDALQDLARDAALTGAIARGDIPGIDAVFRSYYEQYPCYAIQWVDETLRNRAGYPKANSLIDYQFDVRKHPERTAFVQKVMAQAEAEYDAPLLEGSAGHFHLVPVFAGGAYRGMVYTIRIRP